MRRHTRSNGGRKAARHPSDPDSAAREPSNQSFSVRRHQTPAVECWPQTTVQNFISTKSRHMEKVVKCDVWLSSGQR